MEKKQIKHPPMDLSRFVNCKLKKPLICDLLLVEDFKIAVDAYSGEINDQWILKTVEEIIPKLKTTWEATGEKWESGDITGVFKRRGDYRACKTARKRCLALLEEIEK